MQLGILGSLFLHDDLPDNERDLTPSAAKPRQVLSLLALSANHVVTIPLMIKELWDEDPPRSAMTTIQTYIFQLRKLLTSAPSLADRKISEEVLVTTAGGYTLRLAGDLFDLWRFERLAAIGRRRLADNDVAGAAVNLHEALDLWRGPALVDVQHGQLLSMHVTRLEEARLTTLEQRIEADLRLGRHHDLVSELFALVSQHPFNESLYGKYMLALYRCGRRSDALAAFHRLRRALVDELGLEPSPPVQRLHQAILATDPGLEDVDPVELGAAA
jgi:SARP family transcriptional regulator, regulator of embCAB operon